RRPPLPARERRAAHHEAAPARKRPCGGLLERHAGAHVGAAREARLLSQTPPAVVGDGLQGPAISRDASRDLARRARWAWVRHLSLRLWTGPRPSWDGGQGSDLP